MKKEQQVINEKKIKEKMLIQNKNELNSQIMEKNKKIQEIVKEKEDDTEFVKQAVNRFEKMQEEKLSEAARMKKQYSEILNAQINNKTIIKKLESQALSKPEKDFNSGVLKKIEKKEDFYLVSVPGFQKSDYPAEKCLSKSFAHFPITKSIEDNDHSVENKVYNLRRSQMLSFDCNRHNPISNPIGTYENYCKRNNKRGKGLALLNVGSYIIRQV